MKKVAPKCISIKKPKKNIRNKEKKERNREKEELVEYRKKRERDIGQRVEVFFGRRVSFLFV